MASSVPSAVLWDLDGTLVDTEPDWIACERALVESYGGRWTDADSLALVGSDLLTAGAHIRDRGACRSPPRRSSNGCSTRWWTGCGGRCSGGREPMSC